MGLGRMEKWIMGKIFFGKEANTVSKCATHAQINLPTFHYSVSATETHTSK